MKRRRLSQEEYPLKDEKGETIPLAAAFRPISIAALHESPEPLNTVLVCESAVSPIRYVSTPPDRQMQDALSDPSIDIGIEVIYYITSYGLREVTDGDDTFLVATVNTRGPRGSRTWARFSLNHAIPAILEKRAVPIGNHDLEMIYLSLSAGNPLEKLDRLKFENPEVLEHVRLLCRPPAQNPSVITPSDEDLEKMVRK